MASRGFTLIELMIVMAITSILASFAVPQFMNFRGKAERAEAKASLGAIFRAEKTLVGEINSYTDSLVKLQWEPEGAPRYIVGFTSDAVPSSSGINDSAELGAVRGFSTKNMIGAFGLPLVEGDLPVAVVSKEAFTIGAAGNIDGDADLDQWVLNDANEMLEINSDIPE